MFHKGLSICELRKNDYHAFWRPLRNTSVGGGGGAELATAGDARVARLLKLHLSLLVPLPVVCGSPRPCCFVSSSERFVSKINVLKFPCRVAQCIPAQLVLKFPQHIFKNIRRLVT
jgi:hypothetical protein